jgi:hypothetical protein
MTALYPDGYPLVVGGAARLVTAVGLFLSSLVLQAGPAGAVDPLPDLGMAPLRDLSVVKLADGRKLLRFTSEIVNVGTAPFELRAERADTASPMVGRQYVNGVAVGPATYLVFGGDGHNHWHVKNLAKFKLETLDGKSVGVGVKLGFCFWDNHVYRAGAGPAGYSSSGCGTSTSLQLTMGLTPGWGDVYPWTLPDQYVDITKLPRGKYRLRAVANDGAGFVESTAANNGTWVDIKIGRRSANVLATGPTA